MKYEIIVKPSAEKQLAKLPKSTQKRVTDKLPALESAPRIASTKLYGAVNTWRIRVGDYRVVYEIDDAEEVVRVTIIVHRREVYRDL